LKRETHKSSTYNTSRICKECLFFNNFAAKQNIMTTEEYFYLEHYLTHYSIIFGNNNMKSLFKELEDYHYFLFKNTEQISFEEGKSKVEYFYNKAQPFDYWPKPTFRIDDPKPFA
jgi:hypothetical protein